MQLDLVFVGLPTQSQSDWAMLAERAGLKAWFFETIEYIDERVFEGADILLAPFGSASSFQELKRQYKVRGGGDLAVSILARADYLLSCEAFRAGAHDVIALPLARPDCIALFKNLKSLSAKTLHPDAILPLDIVEKNAIRIALRACNGQVSKTSRKLGIGRSTLYRKLEQYELAVRI